MGYDRIRPSLDIESNLKSGIVRGGRSRVANGLKNLGAQNLFV